MSNPYEPPNDSAPHHQPKPTNVRWAVFTLSCITSWLLYLHRYAFGFIKPELKTEWGLGNDELGYLDSAFSFFYTLFQFPLGIAADVTGVHLILTTLIVLWSGGLAMHAWAPSLTAMWYARATLGIGQSAVFANVSRMGRRWFPLSIRTTLLGVSGVTAGRLGGLSTALIFGYLLLGVFQLNWRTAVYILAAAGIVHAGVFAFIFRNSPRHHPRVNAAEADLIESLAAQAGQSHVQVPARLTLRQALGRMSPRSLINLICLNVQSILSTFADNIYSNWIPLFLFEVYQLKFKEMGIYSALPLLGGAIAGLVGGALNDWMIAKTGNRRWSRSGIAFVGKGLAAALLFVALLWYDNPFVFCGFLFFVKLFGDWSLTTSWGVVNDIGGGATASVFAFNNTVAGIGSIAAPAIYGLIAEHFDWTIVFITAACAYVLCALSWLLIDCTIPLVEE